MGIEFVTLAKWEHKVTYKPDPKSKVSLDGYIPFTKQIENISMAGLRLLMQRKAEYPAGGIEDEAVSPFQHRMEVAVRLKKLYADLEAEKAAQNEARQKNMSEQQEKLFNEEVEKRLKARLKETQQQAGKVDPPAEG